MLEAAGDLYALAPAEFTAARNQLAKQLKAAGRADDAQMVAKLRKPRLAEWALNRVARDDRALVDRFALAIAAAHTAQSAAIGGPDGPVRGDIREATAALRQALAATADAAVRGVTADGGNGEAQRDDLTAILRDLISAADATPLLAGVIGSEALVTSGEFFPGAPDPPARPSRGEPPAADESGVAPTSGTRPGACSGTKPSIAGSAAPHSAPEPTSAPAVPATGRSAAAIGTAAARKAMARAERHGLQQAATTADRAVATAQAAVDAATAELTRRTADLKAARAASRAAAAALATFDGHAD